MMTDADAQNLDKTMTHLFEHLERAIIENVALKMVLKKAHPIDPNTPPLPEQVKAAFPQIQNEVRPKLARLRNEILKSLREGKIPQKAGLVDQMSKLVN